VDGFVFILMQMIGALLAYAVYRFVFAKAEGGLDGSN